MDPLDFLFFPKKPLQAVKSIDRILAYHLLQDEFPLLQVKGFEFIQILLRILQ